MNRKCHFPTYLTVDMHPMNATGVGYALKVTRWVSHFLSSLLCVLTRMAFAGLVAGSSLLPLVQWR